MPRIALYDSRDTRLTPPSEGFTAWEGAGRRIGPAYNEAASLEREGAKEVAQATELSASQMEKFQKAIDSQYKDLYDIGLEEDAAAKRNSSGGGRGGAGGVSGFGDTGRGGGGGSYPSGYGTANEILNGANKIATHSWVDPKTGATDWSKLFPTVQGSTGTVGSMTSYYNQQGNYPLGTERDLTSSEKNQIAAIPDNPEGHDYGLPEVNYETVQPPQDPATQPPSAAPSLGSQIWSAISSGANAVTDAIATTGVTGGEM